jgi:hypothetical protein
MSLGLAVATAIVVGARANVRADMSCSAYCNPDCYMQLLGCTDCEIIPVGGVCFFCAHGCWAGANCFCDDNPFWTCDNSSEVTAWCKEIGG